MKIIPEQTNLTKEINVATLWMLFEGSKTHR